MAFLQDNELLIFWGGLITVLSGLLSLIAVPWLVARLPEDYFCHRRRAPLRRKAAHPLPALALAALKNLIGLLLVLLGLVMFVTPGQGLLTLLVGLMLLNFPGKYRLERWIVTRPKVLPALNWIRRKMGKRPLVDP